MRILTDYYKATKSLESKYRFEIDKSTKSYEIFESTLLNKRSPNAGGLSFNYSDVPEQFKAVAKRKADKCISRGGNVSSVYVPNVSLPYAWGDIQNPKTKIITNDALLIVFSSDLTQMELFIARDHRNDARQLYQMLCDGILDTEIEALRKLAK